MIPVITGMGLVSSLGGDVRAAFAAYCRGENAVRPLREFDRARYRVTNAYEIADGASAVPGRASRWLREAVTQALAQALLRDRRPPGEGGIPVIVGTGLAEQRSLELWHCGDAPLTAAGLDFRAALGGLGAGGTITLVNACSAGLYALAVAADLLELGEAQTVVVAASDSISESMFGLLDRVNPRPPDAVRPFDADRKGVILGEGAAAVVLETPDAARSRGARPLARVRGVATGCDAHHETAPLREGLSRTFRDAHRRAGVTPRQIDLIMAHGTGTPLNDATEAAALGEVFGDDMSVPLVAALKSQIGHTSGASGLMSLVVAAEAMRSGQVPPVLNLGEPIRAARGFRFSRGRPHRASMEVAQVNAFGFGGINAVALLDTATSTSAATAATRPRQAGAAGPVVVTGTGLEVPGAGGRGLLALAGAGNSVACRGAAPEFDGGMMRGKRGLRYKDRATRLALSAVARALAAAGLDAAVPPRGTAESARFGVVVSTNFAIAETVCRVVRTIHDGGVVATSPMDLPNVSGNSVASSIAIWFGLAGHNITVSAGATSGTDAIHLAACAIRAGRADRMVVVGVEPASEPASRLAEDGAGVRPGTFDGAAALVLESAAAARARDAGPLALVGGHAYRGALADSVSEVAKEAAAVPASLWFAPCTHHPAVAAEALATGRDLTGDHRAWRPPVELSAVTGEASGALGVLQCAAAAEWLAGHRDGSAVASSGGCWGAGFASLALRGCR